MDKQFFFFLPIAIIIAGIALINFFFTKNAIVKRKLKKATGKKISEFVSGEVAKVAGKVEYVGKPLIAPLSGRPCAYYSVIVKEKDSSESSNWNSLIEEEVAGTFVIRDGKYCAHINCNHVKSYIVKDMNYSSGFLDDATDVLEDFLQKHGQKSEDFLGLNKSLHYKEGILEEGELMAVVGRGEWKNASQVGLPESYGRILDISSTEEEPVYLSDDPETVETKYA